MITVGVSDTGKSVSTNDDTAAPWSAYGYTLDGFAKPDISAPGRYKALNKFLVSDPVTGSPVFDAASWASAAKSDASWASASWSDASWASASWASASWASASWDSSASAAASWSDMSLASASWADNAEGETPDVDGGLIDPLELEAVLSGTLEP